MYPELVDTAAKQIASILSVENVLALYEQVHLYEVGHLNEDIVHFLQFNTIKVLKHKSFLDIKISTLEFILSQPKLLATEFELINACIEWAKTVNGQWANATKSTTWNDHDQFSFAVNTPRGVLGNLIYKIRLPCLNEKEFACLMQVDQFFSKEEKLDILSYLSFKQHPAQGFLAKFEFTPRNVPRCDWVKFDLSRVGPEKGQTYKFILYVKCKDTVYLCGIRLRYSGSCGLICRHNQLEIVTDEDEKVFFQKDFKLWSSSEEVVNTVEFMLDVPIFLTTIGHTLMLDLSCNCKNGRLPQARTEKTRVDIRGGTAKTSIEYMASCAPECIADISLALY